MAIKENRIIFIVDDNVDFHTVAAAVFKKSGYIVKSFFEGKLQEIKSICPSCDLILLDVALPGDSGIDICRSIKDDPRSAHIPVILITGNADTDDLCAKSKADACLRKPFSSAELVRQVEQHLEKGSKAKVVTR